MKEKVGKVIREEITAGMQVGRKKEHAGEIEGVLFRKREIRALIRSVVSRRKTPHVVKGGKGKGCARPERVWEKLIKKEKRKSKGGHDTQGEKDPLSAHSVVAWKP